MATFFGMLVVGPGWLEDELAAALWLEDELAANPPGYFGGITFGTATI